MVGSVDLMLPTVGDRSHNFYLDPNVAYGADSQGYADLGLGYRWIKNNAAILGLYVFGGYTRIDNNARLWVANPGIEALGSRWDAHLNAYFPMGNRNQMLGNDVQGFYFTGHSEFAELIQLSQYAGNGADVKLGYQLFPHSSLKGYVGSYFFNPSQTSNIWGGAAGLEYWMDSNVKVFASYTYDNLRHSTGAFGLGIEFGGTHAERINPTLEERITDPVEHYLAELGRGSAIPSQLKTEPAGSLLLFNNIAFFSQTGGPNNGGVGLSLANCTFENPCGPTDLTNLGASTLSALLPNTRMYFNRGSYNALDVPGGTTGVTLQPGQTVESRTTDYTQLATGAARSTFNGGFILPGNNTLENITLLPTPATRAGLGFGISSTGGRNLFIKGSQIGSTANPFKRAIILTNVNNALIQNSNVIMATNDFNTTMHGISILQSSGVTIQNSNLTGFSNTTASYVVPIFIVSSSSVTIENSNVVASKTNISNNSFTTTGISVNTSTLTVINSNITSTSTTADTTEGIVVNGSGSVVNLNNSQVNVSNTDTGGTSIINTLRRNSPGSSITVRNGVLAAAGGTGTSPNISNGSNITINSSICYLNGSLVPCP
jgi:hypothetical protein